MKQLILTVHGHGLYSGVGKGQLTVYQVFAVKGVCIAICEAQISNANVRRNDLVFRIQISPKSAPLWPSDLLSC